MLQMLWHPIDRLEYMNHLTSFNITTTVKYTENEILKKTGLSQAAFHRKAIDAFLAGDQKIDRRLKIKEISNPEYVKRSFKELIYLDDERRKLLEPIMERENVGITVVLFQALYDYCFEMASVLDHDVVKNIIEGNYTL
jgi:hypothetical protein